MTIIDRTRESGMTDWQPISTAPKTGELIEGKESSRLRWPDGGRTRYKVRDTQWVSDEGWMYYSRGEGVLWKPERWRSVRRIVGRNPT